MEMNETAHILRAATAQSLVIMDEIGGESTHRDGLCHCMGRVPVHPHADTGPHPFCNALPRAHAPGARERAQPVDGRTGRDGEIVFLKRVRQGPSSNSYGIHVARLAGLPRRRWSLRRKSCRRQPRLSRYRWGLCRRRTRRRLPWMRRPWRRTSRSFSLQKTSLLGKSAASSGSAYSPRGAQPRFPMEGSAFPQGEELK